ncbi:MAG: GNAT family N-acetyltransferase [Rhodothermales bacterium]
MTGELKIIIARNSVEIAAAQEIRKRVFVEEQVIPAHLDDDGLDGSAFHMLCCYGDTFAATGRLVVLTPHEGVLSRIAVLPGYRGRGVGGLIVKKLETLAVEQGIRELSLHPHQYLEDFYMNLGYKRVSGTSQVGGYELITMQKIIGGLVQ